MVIKNDSWKTKNLSSLNGWLLFLRNWTCFSACKLCFPCSIEVPEGNYIKDYRLLNNVFSFLRQTWCWLYQITQSIIAFNFLATSDGLKFRNTLALLLYVIFWKIELCFWPKMGYWRVVMLIPPKLHYRINRQLSHFLPRMRCATQTGSHQTNLGRAGGGGGGR